MRLAAKNLEFCLTVMASIVSQISYQTALKGLYPNTRQR